MTNTEMFEELKVIRTFFDLLAMGGTAAEQAILDVRDIATKVQAELERRVASEP